MSDSLIISAEVQSKIEQVKTKSYDISFNELLDMLKAKELIIQPEYQRLFRWSEGNQSRFMESLILEMPVPPIFVIEIEEGRYELIDGLQRIGSYMHFRGEHPDFVGEDGTLEYLKLVDCDIVKALNELTYKDLPQSIQIRLKRSFVRMEVIRKESDSRSRYYMFKRLNTGGARLSEQEIRNCTIRLLNNTFNDFIISLSSNEDFISCIENVSEEKIFQKGDQELVLRFFTFKNWGQHYKHEVDDFMTDYMEGVTANEIPFDYEKEKVIFERTFKLLNRALGDKAFSNVGKRGKLVSRFLAYHYEAFTIGMNSHLDKLEQKSDSELESMLTDIKKAPEFIKMTTGGGKNYSNQLQARINFVSSEIEKRL